MENAKREMLAQKLMDAVNNNDDFCKAFVSAEDAPSVQKVLKENGFDVSLEDVEAIFLDGLNEIKKLKSTAPADVLSEEQLDDVAGGGAIRGTLRFIASGAAAFGYGCLCGLCPAASVGTPYVAVGLAAWTTDGYLKKGW